MISKESTEYTTKGTNGPGARGWCFWGILGGHKRTEPRGRRAFSNIHPTHLELSVALRVFQHVQQELRAFLGPAALRPAPLLGL